MSTDVLSRALLSRREVADLFAVTPKTVDRWRRRGVLRSVQVVPGGHLR